MSLLEKATIITTPTAHSNGTLHSIKGGAVADFDVVRGSVATRVNADGLIEDISVLSEELVANGDFSNGSTDWTIYNNTGTSTNISNGVLNIVTDGTVTSAQQSNVFTIGKEYKVTFDVIATNGSNLANSTNSIIYDTSTIGSKVFYVVPDSTTFALKRASGVTDVTIDNISVKEVIDATNIPRVDYTTGEGVVLLEPQSTNLIPYSEDFTQWTDAGTLTKTGNYSLSPSGEVNATRLQWSSGTNFTFQGLSHVGSDFTLSIYLKSNTDVSQNVRLFMDNGFQGKDVVVTTQWQRFELTNTTTPTQSNRNVGLIKSGGQVGDLDISIWGAQFEALPYATSYIPTSGAIATRLADKVTGAGDVNTFNSTEGVLYAEIAALNDDGTNRAISLNSSSSGNSVRIYFDSSGLSEVTMQVRSGGALQVFEKYVLPNSLGFNKIAVSYKLNSFSLWVNGGKVKTDTSGITPIGLNQLSFNNGSSDNFYGKVKALAVFNEALTDSELECLTTI